MQQHNVWCVCVCILCEEVCWTRVQHTSSHRTHTHTHQTLYCRITTLTFYIFNKFLKSVTLTRSIWAPWRWSEWWL